MNRILRPALSALSVLLAAASPTLATVAALLAPPIDQAYPAPDEATTEYWVGQILVPNPACAQITFVATLTRTADTWTGRFSMSPGCGVNGLFDVALEEVTRTKETIRFVTPPPPNRNSYELTLAAGERSGSGRIVIGGVQPLFIRASRVTEAEARNVAPKRPQVPSGPVPYQQQQVLAKIAGPSGSLAGVLTAPPSAAGAAPERSPAILLLSDEEPVDLDHTEGTHKPGLVLADLLTRQGFIVLRCASPGINNSGGTYLASSLADAAADTAGLVAYLKTLPSVDPARVFLVGRGEGAYIAARTAADSTDLAGVVLMAPAAMPWRDLLLVRERKQFQTQGEDPAYVTARIARYTAILDAAARSDAETLNTALNADFDAMTRSGRAMGILNAFQQRDSLQVQADFYLTPRIVARLNEDSKPFLERTRTPVLALAGERDLQIPPAETLPAVEAALKKAGNARVTVRTFPRLNHWFQPCVTGFPDERDQIETTIDPSVADAIATWVKSLPKP